jgi:hypothetical protein
VNVFLDGSLLPVKEAQGVVHPTWISIDIGNSLIARPRLCIPGHQQPLRSDGALLRKALKESSATEAVVVTAKPMIMKDDSVRRVLPTALAVQSVECSKTVCIRNMTARRSGP